jgi:anti-sigma factor RsiW
VTQVDPSSVCERVRAQISLELDGQLSQLERVMLARHVERCADCRAYRADVTAATYALRHAPLEPVERSVSVRRPSRLTAARLQVAVAAMVALVTLGIASEAVVSEPERSERVRPVGAVSRFPSPRELEREQQILESLRAGQTAGRMPFSASPAAPI